MEKKYVLIILDTGLVSENKKSIFFSELYSRFWDKIPGLDNAWELTFSQIYAENAIAENIDKTIRAAAKCSHVKKISYAFQIGHKSAIVGKVERLFECHFI